MRLKYLGDSYDFVKRSLLHCLSALGPWSVIPMFTESGEAERASELEAFLKTTVIATERLTVQNRPLYFKEATIDQHLFIDPNTGLRLAEMGGKRALDYFLASELLLLSEKREKYLTMIFDQSLGRAPESARRDEIGEKLRKLNDKGLFGFAYYSHACFLILSGDQTISSDAKECLHQGLGLPKSRLLETPGTQVDNLQLLQRD